VTFPVHLVAAVGAVATDVNEDPEVWAEVRAALVMSGYRDLPSFQRGNGLPPTGRLDPETLDALGVAFA